MYLLQQTNDGYEFETYKGVKYSVYFTQLAHLSDIISKSGLSPENFWYFGIERTTPKIGGKDDFFIKRTVAFILFDFFTKYREAVVVFNYSSTDGRINSRRKKFKSWFDEYSTHTLFQLYQHDFTDVNEGSDFSVCAIYRRYGNLEFDNLKSGIEELIKNLNKSSGVIKD